MSDKTLRIIIIVLCFVLGIAVATQLMPGPAKVGGDKRGETPAAIMPRANFVEVKWPFLRDQWGDGRAFRCAASDCGVAVELYLRPKIGFCNCDSGVSDDGELDRVGDLELFSDRFVGLAAGDEVRVGWMSGRSRIYRVDVPYAQPRPVLAIAFNQNCDVMVATVVAALEHLPDAGRHALDFLNGEPQLQWARAQFGV